MNPKVMVLLYQPGLTCSVWVDFYRRSRNIHTLIRYLKKEVKRGTYLGFRIIEIEREEIGVVS